MKFCRVYRSIHMACDSISSCQLFSQPMYHAAFSHLFWAKGATLPQRLYSDHCSGDNIGNFGLNKNQNKAQVTKLKDTSHFFWNCGAGGGGTWRRKGTSPETTTMLNSKQHASWRYHLHQVKILSTSFIPQVGNTKLHLEDVYSTP